MCDAQGDDNGMNDALPTSRKRARAAEGDAATVNVSSSLRNVVNEMCEAFDSMSQRSWPGFFGSLMYSPQEREVEAWLGARDGTWDVQVDFMKGPRVTEREPAVDSGRVVFDGRPGCAEIHRATIEEFIANDGELTSGKTSDSFMVYGAQIPLSELSQRARDVISSWTPTEFREYFASKGVNDAQTNMWVNRKCAVETNWHYDNYDNVLTVCTGRKRVRLRAPAFYTRQEWLPFGAGTVSLRDPVFYRRQEWLPFAAGTDFSNHFPEIQGTELDCDDFEIILERGHSVFIPSGWYHRVESWPNTLAISRWWVNDFNTNLSKSIFTRWENYYDLEGWTVNLIGRYNTYHFRRTFEFALDGIVKSMRVNRVNYNIDVLKLTLKARDSGLSKLTLLGLAYADEKISLDKYSIEKYVASRGQNILKDIWNTSTSLEEFRELPINFITLLQEARVAAHKHGRYRLAHVVDFIWRELQRHVDDDSSWSWTRFYDECKAWSKEWISYMESEKHSGTRSSVPPPYPINCAKDVVNAVLKNQRLAVAYRTTLLLNQTLDSAFTIDIKVKDDSDLPI